MLGSAEGLMLRLQVIIDSLKAGKVVFVESLVRSRW